MKAKPSTKEQLIYFLYNHISLGTYDKKFINNLVTMYVTTLKPVTTNQSVLLDKIVLRYERQLRKEEIDANEMVKLPWNISPVESLPTYTQAHIKIVDDTIEVRSPFKSEFIKEFKELPNTRWEREAKTWYASASEKTLKKIIVLVNKHYETVNYCDETKNILNTVEMNKDPQYWNPTLVKTNGLFYIAATNNTLDETIKHIPLNDSLSSIARLAYHGITISRSVLNDISKDITDDEILFAVERDVTMEFDIPTLTKRLKMIGTDLVVVRELNTLTNPLYLSLKTNLEPEGVIVENLQRNSTRNLENIRKAKLPVIVSGTSFITAVTPFFAKVVGLKNSNPIDIK